MAAHEGSASSADHQPRSGGQRETACRCEPNCVVGHSTILLEELGWPFPCVGSPGNRLDHDNSATVLILERFSAHSYGFNPHVTP